MIKDRWPDLQQRVLSALVLAVIGLGAVVLGGLPFAVFIALLTAVMVWELVGMTSGKDLVALALAGLTGLILFFAPGGFIVSSVALLIAIPLAAASVASDHKPRVFFYAIMVVTSGPVMEILRFELGLIWVLWLVLVVIATDVAGYFAGRMIGGPKFWPAISPKKTWAGVVAGWIAAGIVGAAFDVVMFGPLVMLSILVSAASQMGDIAESSIKRRFDVKDSSNLIPGHGGFLDRFDAMIAATLVLGIISLLAPGGLHFFEMGWR